MSIQMQIHGIYALAWCTSVVESYSVNEMPEDLVRRLADLRIAEPFASFRSNSRLRPTVEILNELDVAYCMHWAWRHAVLSDNRNRGTNHMYMSEFPLDYRCVLLCECLEGEPVNRECKVGLLPDLTNRRVDVDTRLALRTGDLTVARRFPCSVPRR